MDKKKIDYTFLRFGGLALFFSFLCVYLIEYMFKESEAFHVWFGFMAFMSGVAALILMFAFFVNNFAD